MTNNKDLNYIAECAESVGIHVDEHTAISIPFIADVMRKMREQEPCEDCISRKEALDLVEDMTDQFGVGHRVITEGVISMLPPVTPKPKTGHWKFIQRGKFIDICCSECGYVSVKDYAYNYTIDQLDEQEKKEFFAKAHMNFCECCGAKMLPTDSEKENNNG